MPAPCRPAAKGWHLLRIEAILPLSFVAKDARLSAMNRNLDTLPEGKRAELEFVVKLIRDRFAFATARRTMPNLRGGKLLKIILFGSYARGDWVDAPASANQYKSDYDILVIVSQKELTDRAAYWAKAEERLIRAYTIEKTLRTPVNFIVHSLHEVNDGLAHGRVFFMEVAKDGIAIYDADGRELQVALGRDAVHQPQPRGRQQR